MKIRVFSIEEFSIYDGPGIRTTVFLKGCPLNCNWCHSPEGKKYDNEVIRNEKTLPDGTVLVEKRMAANDYDVKELADKLRKNFKILNSNGGGVTFSGGEPLFHAKRLLALINEIHGETHLAIQTSGYAPHDIFKEVISKLDLVLFDMKIVDQAKAIEFQGVSNKLIFENLEILKQSDTPFIARVPLIPGVIDTEENILAIIEKIKDAPNLLGVELLPYNKYAGSKHHLIGEMYTPMFDETVASNPRLKLFEKAGLKVRIV